MRPIKLKDFFSIGFCSLIIIASYIRIYYGVDLTDESFYISLPYRFILGDRPILNEYSMYQFAGTLIYPFYKLFFLINQSMQGIVLFARHLYFISFLLLGSYLFAILKKYLSWQISLLIASIAVLNVPFNIMGLSYNTIAVLCFTLGVFSTFKYQQSQQQKNSTLIFSGLCYSLAVYVYPTFFIPVISSMFVLCFFVNYKKVIVNLFIGALPIICLFLWLLYNANFEAKNLFNYLHQTGYTNKGIFLFYSLFISWIQGTPKLLYAFLILLLPWRKQNFLNQIRYVALLILPFILLAAYLFQYLYYKNPMIWYQLIINFTFLAPIYYPFAKNQKFFKPLFYLIWIPAILAGFATSITSANGFVNFIVGLFPGFIISIVTIYLAFSNFHEFFRNNQKKAFHKIFSIAPTVILISLLAILLIYKFSFIYRDSAFFNLQSRIENGPYKNLYTTERNKQFINQVNDDMNDLISSYHPKSILIFPSFSGLYLFTNLKPQTNSVWLFAKFNNVLTLDYFERTLKTPEIAFVFKPYLKQKNDALFNYINSNKYIAIKDRKLYTIYISHNFIDQN